MLPVGVSDIAIDQFSTYQALKIFLAWVSHHALEMHCSNNLLDVALHVSFKILSHHFHEEQLLLMLQFECLVVH